MTYFWLDLSQNLAICHGSTLLAITWEPLGFRAAAGIGTAALLVNDFDIGSQWWGARKIRAKVADLINTYFNDFNLAPSDLVHQGAQSFTPAVARWLDANLGGRSTPEVNPRLSAKQSPLSTNFAAVRPNTFDPAPTQDGEKLPAALEVALKLLRREVGSRPAKPVLTV
jgi:hypothetical protein